jgi:carboxyl-terminal processing protease
VPSRKLITPVAVIGVIGATLGLMAADRTVSDYEWFDPIIVVRRFLLDGFHKAPDEEAIQRAMIDAMITTLDDPYTLYVPPADEAEFNKVLRGTYVGIGAEVNVQGEYLTIVSPLDDSPALDAGIMAGDIVLAIEGQTTYDRPVDDCIDQLLGEPGTPVNIRVRHLDGTEKDLSIIRREIVTRSVKGVRRSGEEWDYWLDQGRQIGYVRINQFVDGTYDELRTAIAVLLQGGLRGLVLDVRGNPGGGLGAAIETADLFLDDGKIVSVRGRTRRPQTWRARSEGTLPDFPMIVMINRHSASASEIVAGALQDNGRAKILGTRSFGKGSVQEVHELPYDRGTLKMTSGHYYLPSDRNISRADDNPVWGVDPDPGFVVPMSDEKFRNSILARRQYGIIRPGAKVETGDFADPAWIREQLDDTQLAAALTALRSRLDTDTWPVVGEGDATQLALAERISDQLRIRRLLLERITSVEEDLGELNDLAERSGRPSLLPEDADLTDAVVTVRDRDGVVIGQYRVLGGDLEFALRQVELDILEDGD